MGARRGGRGRDRPALRPHARLTYTHPAMRRSATSESAREPHIGVRARVLLGGLLLLPLRGDA